MVKSLLVRETNEMETLHLGTSTKRLYSPYSLGKLMKWKLRIGSLTELINLSSLLVRETNEMETYPMF